MGVEVNHKAGGREQRAKGREGFSLNKPLPTLYLARSGLRAGNSVLAMISEPLAVG